MSEKITKKKPIIGNARQDEAIRHKRGPCLVLAGPGSGKTFVLTEHVHFLIRYLHVDPAEILVLTFSKAAAKEMKARYEKKYGAEGRAPVTFGTFHAVFYHILQQSEGGKDLHLVDLKTKQGLLKRLVDSCHYGRIEDPTLRMNLLYSEILYRKKNPHAHWKYFADEENFPRLFREYQTFMQDEGLIDFDDMIRLCNDLLKKDASILSSWRSRYHFFLLDEFQDIDLTQLETIELLADRDCNIFAVGDDDQSIYSFRGANPKVMQTFLDHHEGLHLVELTKNYRSTERILTAAARLIRDNEDRLEKQQVAEHRGGEPVRIEGYSDESAQFAKIFEEIEEGVRHGGRSYEDFAVIFRMHYQAENFRRFLLRRGLGSVEDSSFQDPAVSAALSVLVSYYRCAVAMRGGMLVRDDFCRIMNVPQRYLLRHTFLNPKEPAEKYLLSMPPGVQQEVLFDLYEDLRLLGKLLPELSLPYLLNDMKVKEGILSGKRQSARDALLLLFEELQEKAPSCRNPEEMIAYLEERQREPQHVQKSAEDASGLGVHLITMHASKGLEFPVVYLPCLNEGVIPVRSAYTDAGIEEERRLLYVAMTRAKEELILMYAKGLPGQDRRPSRFLRTFHVYASWE